MPNQVQDAAAVAVSFEQGKAAWPGISISIDQFARRAGELEVTESDLRERAAELVLAVACGAGDPVALGWFDTRYLSAIATYVSRFNLSADLLDEVRQRVRIKQLLGDQPGIARYNGRGALGAWVRVSAVRVALDVVAEAGAPTAALDIDLPELWSSLHDGPEVETLKKVYRERLMTGLEESLALLEARDRTLLRLHVVDNLGIDAIARIYRVHRATAARWLIAIRGRIFELLRERLAVRFDISTAELRSVVKLLRSEIHLSAQRVLADG